MKAADCVMRGGESALKTTLATQCVKRGKDHRAGGAEFASNLPLTQARIANLTAWETC